MFSIKSLPRSLCDTCYYSVIAKDAHGHAVIRICSAGPTTISVPDVIKECNSFKYDFLSAPFEMERMAWTLEVKGTRVIGFKPPVKKRDDD